MLSARRTMRRRTQRPPRRRTTCLAFASSSKTTRATPSLTPTASRFINSKAIARPSIGSSTPSKASRSRLCPKSSDPYSNEPNDASSNLRGEKRDLPLLRLNGKDRVRIKTLHGSFEFAEQRFVLPDGSACRYLKLREQSLWSSGIEELGVYLCNRLSFAEVAKLIERITGERSVCEQTLCNWVRQKAKEVSEALRAEIGVANRSLPLPTLAEEVDIYDPEAEEVLVFTDAIQVKAQKPTRMRRKEEVVRSSEPSSSSSSSGSNSSEKKKKKRISTDLMLFEGRDGSFRYLSAGLEEEGQRVASLSEVAQAHLRREWGERLDPLPIVAITDGARSIRSMFEEVFGPYRVRVILDWYHLAKKVYQLLSMVAHSKAEREGMQEEVLSLLWHGGVGEALRYLAGVKARRQEALEELVVYLKKHASEIIDYERRAKTGKAIGSGRMEKAVDQAVGMRQKKKGMSWSEDGSQGLALLKVVELNGEWDELWAEAGMAA